MAEQKDSKGGFEIFVDRYRDIARRARKEADDAKRADDMMGARQAAEKSYLAAVHAARQILICAGITSTRKPRQPSAAIARANQLVGELGLRREEAVDNAMRALGRALKEHTSCFYEGVCDIPDIVRAAHGVERAAKDLPAVCHLVQRASGGLPPSTDEFAGTAAHVRQRGTGFRRKR